MRRLDWSILRDDGLLVLMTAEEGLDGEEMQMADFRDWNALFYLPLRSWLGMSRSGVELSITGQDPELLGGIWYVRRDDALCIANRDLVPASGTIVLRKIVP